MENRPDVGIGVMVVKDGKMLMGKRKGSHGEGEYATPGGHFEYMESFEATAKREVKEETGMEIKNVEFVALVNMKEYAPKHYVHIWLKADWNSGEPQVLEPEKCESWDWYEINNLPQPTFRSTKYLAEALKTGRNYFDS